ncbi:hypothetical protein H312_02167 [Anncaliia algerae PRA339]|uniref:poly(A)-specific ribonuclease n=1 Tax=Anncaliia algerae PRA339 TaxID=1288291 RepID=A0A059EZH0_9MICR|nr:hypothetical protein H312_02167 [Anncaliia algerae PRA339]
MSTPTRKRSNQKKTVYRSNIAEIPPNTWEGLDLSNQGLRNISPEIFEHTFIRELNLDGNQIKEIPSEISKLEYLEIISASNNKLWRLPPEICKCKNLKTLDLSDNHLSSIPLELGNLYQIEHLDLDKNPLIEPFSSVYKNRGGIGLISFCREHNLLYPEPFERQWMLINLNYEERELIKIGSYNILAARCCNAKNYPFLPLNTLKPEWRFESILNEIMTYNVDILSLQELENMTYKSLFSTTLEDKCFYDSVFFPKSRIKALSPLDKESVDGCVIFWKKNLFKLIEQKNIEFVKLIAEHPLMSKYEDILIRNSDKDNIAVMILLEKINKDQLIIVNAHLHWNHEFSDIKLLQSVVLLEEISKFKKKYPKAGIVLCGDFNSLKDSEVISFIKNGQSEIKMKEDFLKFEHKLKMIDTHENIDFPFTHFHVKFKALIDYILCTDNIGVEKILLPPNSDYFDSIIALPTVHFPSDHLFIGAEVYLKKNKD